MGQGGVSFAEYVYIHLYLCDDLSARALCPVLRDPRRTGERATAPRDLTAKSGRTHAHTETESETLTGRAREWEVANEKAGERRWGER